MRNSLFRVKRADSEQSSKGVVIPLAGQRYRKMKSKIADKALDKAIEAQFSMFIPDLPPVPPLQDTENINSDTNNFRIN
ncbi:MAG: hypothetical protein GXY50_06740 [Syntrophomonadaceae bacterium]|nr:hypothetical protein [Syntrophomonadaceae bacterium]